ncbi:glycosyltransferase family 39 protein [bacterium]|nr:glycosyltransferase family 39 protein [bacterium]
MPSILESSVAECPTLVESADARIDLGGAGPTARQERVFLLAVMLVGAFLRFFRLGDASFWLDEAIQAGAARVPTLMHAWGAAPLNKPPLFYVIEFLVGRFSISEWALRLPSALAGIATILAVWWVARTLLRDRLAALCAACLVAVSPLHIAYSQEARPYEMAALLSFLSVGAMFSLTAGRLSRSKLLPAALWPALAVWSLYFGLEVFLLQVFWAAGVWVFGRRYREKARGARLFLIAAGMALLLMLPLLARLPSSDYTPPPYPAPPLSARLVGEIFGWLAFGTQERVVWAILPFFLILTVAGAVSLWRRRPAETLFLLLLIGGAQAVQVTSYLLYNHWIAARYHLVYVAPFLLLAGVGLMVCLRRIPGVRKWPQVALGLILLGLAALSFGPAEAARDAKPAMRPAVAKMAREAASNDTVIFLGRHVPYVYRFYRDRDFPQVPDLLDLAERLPVLLSRIRGASTVWVLATRDAKSEREEFVRRLFPALPAILPHHPEVYRAAPREPDWGMWALLAVDSKHKDWREMQARLPLRIGMGESESAPYVGGGWGWPEDWGETTPRWLDGTEGEFFFGLAKQIPTAVTLRLFPYWQEGFPEQTVEVFWNGRSVGKAGLTAGAFTDIKMDLPQNREARLVHYLRIQAAWGRHEHEPVDPSDARNLTVAVEALSIE